MPGSVIVGGARTPIGKLLGALSGFAAVDLGAIAIKAALQRAGISGDQVDYVIMGQVLQAGQGQIPSRQASVKAGNPMSVPSLTINKVCLSGLDAIALADQLITAGEFDVVVAGEMESMTNAPHVLPKARHGYKYGSIEVLDATAHDALTDAFDHVSMGLSTERYNARHGMTREEQDAFAARSHQRAAAAIEARTVQRRDRPRRSTAAERRPHDRRHRRRGSAPTPLWKPSARLRPAFDPDGTITAGSSSQISDGAVRGRGDEPGRKQKSWDARSSRRSRAHGNVAGPDNSPALPAGERDQARTGQSGTGSSC